MTKRLAAGAPLSLSIVAPSFVHGPTLAAVALIGGFKWACFAGGALLVTSALTADPLGVIASGLLMTGC